MAKYLNLAGLTTYDQEIKSWVQALLTEGISDLASALKIRGLINTDTVMHTAYTQAKVGDVYFVSVTGKKLTYYDGAGTLVENEVAEIGDAIICLKAATGSTAATQSRWGALQVNWNVSNSSDAFGFGKTLTVGTVGGVALTVQIPSKEVLGFGTAAALDETGDGDLEGYLSNQVARACDVVTWATGKFVAQEAGKGLSTNDYTTAEKQKLAALPTNANLTTSLNAKADKSTTVTGVAYDTANKKITKTINGTTSDVVTAAKLKTDMGLDNVGNFKGVSTAANQGLNDTEKSNARANIGLGSAALLDETGDAELEGYNNGEVARACDVVDYAVKKEAGKGLSTNDYTTTEKTKLSGIASGATADSAITTAEIQALFA